MRVGCRTALAAVLGGLGTFLSCNAASAHGMFGAPPSFIGGLSHPLSVPGHILSLAAIGLLVGQHGLAKLKISAPLFAVALFAGLIMSLFDLAPGWLELALLGLSVLIGLLIIINLPLPTWLLGLLTVPVALGIGFDSGLSTGEWSLTLSALGGTAVTSTLLFVYLVAITATIYSDRPAWMQIGVRTVGSWITAIAVLILGLIFSQ